MTAAQNKAAAPEATGRGGEDIHEQLHPYQPKVAEGKPLGIYMYYRWRAKQALKEKMAALPHARRIAILRLAELERLMASRYGRVQPVTLPDDDSGRHDLTVMLLVAVFTGSTGQARMEGLAARWAPWLPADQADAMIRGIRSAPRWFTPDHLAFELRITLAEREALSISTMACTELPNKEAREQYRREKYNEQRRESRRRKPRKMTNAEKAKAAGMSLRTWYRKRGTLSGVTKR